MAANRRKLEHALTPQEALIAQRINEARPAIRFTGRNGRIAGYTAINVAHRFAEQGDDRLIPDLFLWDMAPYPFFKNAVPPRTTPQALRWRTKHGLYQALEGRVRRPENISANFGYDEQQAVSSAAKLEKMLLRHGSVFVKPTMHPEWGAEGMGIVRMSLENEGLRAEFALDGHLHSAVNALERIINARKTPLVKHTERNALSVSTDSIGLASVLQMVGPAAFEGMHAIEREVRAPLVDGGKPELRIIVQTVDGKTEIVSRFAKIGGPIVSNIARGGTEANAKKTIYRIYRQRYPTADRRKITAMVDDFLKRADKEALKQKEALDLHLKRHLPKIAKGFPFNEIYARNVAADVMFEFNERTGKLEPFTVEIQYPTFGIGERKTDPRGFDRFRANLEKMKAQGQKVLFKALGITRLIPSPQPAGATTKT